MNQHKTDPQTERTFIEYIINLLGIPHHDHFDLDYLIEHHGHVQVPHTPDAQEIQTACAFISFMDAMPGGFFIYHADGDEKIVYANQALLRIFQCDTIKEFRELTENSFKGMVHPEDLDSVEQSIKEQIRSNQYDLDYVEYRIIRKDGAVRWLEDYGHFIHSESIGDFFYVFVSDATEKRSRLQAEKSAILKDRKQKVLRLQNLMEEYDRERRLIHQEHSRRLDIIEGLSMNYDSILYVDLDSDYIMPYRLSSRTQRQFDQKYKARSFSWYRMDYISAWVHPEDRIAVSRATSPEAIREKLSDRKTYYLNYRVLYYGETQYLQLRIVDVGSQKHISQIVFGYRRVDEEISREMEQRQLLKKALENANLAIVAKNTFLSNMSHDMRTPLNGIFGYTALAKKHLDRPEEAAAYLDKIRDSSEQLLELIDKVLEISWEESDDAQITETECSILEIMQDVQSSLQRMAAKKNITVSLHSAGLSHSEIYSDPDKLKKILLHLANNTVKYTPDGGYAAITAMELENLPNNYAVYQFVVEDNGIGISEEFQKHLFDPFEREKNTTFSGVHGTGLGLAIVKNIVQIMGGSIDVHSQTGVGTKFTVTLRLKKRQDSLLPNSDKEAILERLMKKKILLVEDNEINLEIETEMLKGLGFKIDTAENGRIAVEKMEQAEKNDYALILMDIQMPVMDGRQAAREIRRLKDPSKAHIPIIALSADAFESDKRKSIESGMDAHLPKPIDVPALLDTIARAVRTHEILYNDQTAQP